MDTARGPDSATDAAGPAPEPAYDGPVVQALLSGPHGAHHREVPRARQVFVNRNLRMDRIEAVGFDMDYTIAMYHLQRLETLAFRMTLARMIDALGYPPSVGTLQYDPEFVIRGVVVDKLHGNIFKMDRHNHVGRCYHGRRPLPPDEMRRLYRDEKIHLSLAPLRLDRHALRAARGVPLRRGDRAARRPGRHGRLHEALRRHPRVDRHRPPRRIAQGGGEEGPRPATWCATPSSGRRSTSSAPGARSSSCSPTRCSTTPTR